MGPPDMLSFSVEAAQDELRLLIKKGNGLLRLPRHSLEEVEIALRSESEWVREVYDTLYLVFHKNTHADTLLEMGPRHLRGALSGEIGDHFGRRMKNRLDVLERLRGDLEAGFFTPRSNSSR